MVPLTESPTSPFVDVRQVGQQRVRQVGDRQRLQPHAAGPGQRREEQPLPAEQLVLDPGHHLDVEGHLRLEHPDVAGVHAEDLARLEVANDDLAVQLDPRLRRPAHLLQQESLAAEDAGPELLLEPDRELDPLRRAQEAAALDHQLAAGLHLDRHDLPRHLGRERDLPGAVRDAELRHEDAAATDRALEHAHQPLAPAVWVVVNISISEDIHDISPASETSFSPGFNVISSTGRTVPWICASMRCLLGRRIP